MPEFDETPKEPGTHEAMLARQRERLAGRLNAPAKGTRGLANIVAEMRGRVKHSLFCQCIECVPDVVRLWLNRPKRDECVVLESKQGKKRKARRSKWEQRGTSGN